MANFNGAFFEKNENMNDDNLLIRIEEERNFVLLLSKIESPLFKLIRGRLALDKGIFKTFWKFFFEDGLFYILYFKLIVISNYELLRRCNY